MAHPRKLIRKAVVALLVDAGTAAESRVSSSRAAAFKANELPAIAVYIEEDPVDADSVQTAPRELKHDPEVIVECYVRHSDAYSVDDAMDDLAEQVEAVFDENRYLNGTVGESALVKTERGRADPPTEPLIGIVRLTYAVTYRKDVGAGVANDDFKTVDAKYTPTGGVSDTPVIAVQFTVQET